MRVEFLRKYGQGFPLFALFILIFAFSGCSRSSEEHPVVPPATHPLSRQYIGFGVVNVSFTHLLDEPGAGGVSRGYLRRGTVVRITERRQINNRGNAESWVLAEASPGTDTLSQGWLNEINMEIFDNESRAITASKAMNL